MSTWARRWHTLTAVVCVAALLLQLVLVLQGSAILVEEDPPGLAERVYRYAAYFTIESNLLIAVGTIALARDPAYDAPWWRVVRLAGVVGITVTGLVHFFLLRPLLHLDGLDYVADKLLHMAVPALAVIGFLAFGPRPRVSGRVVALALLFPILWTGWTLAFGAVDGWYPYPFLDPDEKGWAAVLVACFGITVLFLALFGGAQLLDRRASSRPRSSRTVGT